MVVIILFLIPRNSTLCYTILLYIHNIGILNYYNSIKIVNPLFSKPSIRRTNLKCEGHFKSHKLSNSPILKWDDEECSQTNKKTVKKTDVDFYIKYIKYIINLFLSLSLN